MSRKTIWTLAILMLLLATALSSRGFMAQAEPDVVGYEIMWWSIDGGATTMQNAPYTLSGTIGQPDAVTLSADGYVLQGGFWASVVPSSPLIYLPLIQKN